MQIITRLALFSVFMGLAACPGGGDDTGTGTGASTTGTAGGTGGTTEATTGPTSGVTSTTGPQTTGPGTTGVHTTGPGTTTEATTEPGTTTEATTTNSTTTSGSTGEGSTTGGMGGGACQTDADCKLHDDCCSCYGLPKEQPDDPICKALCDKSKCEQAGVDQAVCRFGQCTTEKVKCSGEVACDALPPDCPPGELPGKTDACWTGFCVPAASCDAVQDCSQCPASTMCVEYQTLFQQLVCEPIPEACGDAPNCACAGDLACTDVFTSCNDGNGDTDLVCICPAC